MNRIQIYSAILGLLILLTITLYSKGYWKTWEDYRAEIAAVTSDCYANVVVETGKTLGCQPWNDPEAAMKQCTAYLDPMSKMMIMISIINCNNTSQNKKRDHRHEDSNDF
jgi:hypothetical protein